MSSILPVPNSTAKIHVARHFWAVHTTIMDDQKQLGGLLWQAETLRVTVFPVLPLESQETGWWRIVAGEEPESRTVQPRMGLVQETGRIGGGRFSLTLSCLRDRVDWLFTTGPLEREQAGLPTCGAFSEAVDVFRSALGDWLQVAPPLKRIAFGVVLLAEVSDIRSGYQAISDYLPSVKLDPDGSTDFSYSINRPRSLKCFPGIEKVNRLSRWAVAQVLGMTIAISPGQAVSPALGRTSIACRLELDINTDATFVGEIPTESIPSVLDELIGLGIEIANYGDLP